MGIERRLKVLESAYARYEGQVPGTTLTRVLLGHELFEEEGLAVQVPGRDSEIVWSLGLGGISEPKRFFLGHSLDECLTKAEKAAKISKS